MSDTRPQDYTLNDLPRFSPWPARLLGLEPGSQRVRSRADIVREFEGDKWGPLLARLEKESGPVTIDVVEGWVAGDVAPGLCSVNDEFELLSYAAARARYVSLVESLVARYQESSVIAELGCGFGSLTLRLATSGRVRGRRFLAGDLSPSAVQIVRSLAEMSSLPVEANLLDLSSPSSTELAIEPGSLILTSYAMHYMPTIPRECLEALAALRPSVVIHLEPCQEHCDSQTLLGLMRRRYIEVNDYNTNLVTLLHELECAGRIEIIEETPAVFGQNPLLPASVVIWKPRPDQSGKDHQGKE
jgi:hypothetical protein